jgi:hypothetical protein
MAAGPAGPDGAVMVPGPPMASFRFEAAGGSRSGGKPFDKLDLSIQSNVWLVAPR